MNEKRFAVVDTQPESLTDKGLLPVLGRFDTEQEAGEFIETLPEFESGRYGLDDHEATA